MEIIKKVINIFFWIWSHCPVICLSDDDYFATLKFDNIRNAHLRFSLLNIMLGDSVIYVFSYDIKERKISFIKNLRLIDIDGNVLEDEKIDQIQNRFRMHIAKLLDDDLEIEKEKLLYHIEREEQRISTSVDKINIYATIILTVIPIVVALIDFGSIKDLPIVLQVMICIAVYSLLNICIYIFRTIKVHGIKKSSFSDLRESSDRKKEIVMQYQYDWQQLKYKAQLFVSFVLNLQEWVVVLLILTVGISFGVSVQDDSIASVDIKNTKSIVFTMNAEEIGKPYSNSAVNWQKVLLDIEKKQCNQIIILTDCNEVPEEVKVLAKYKDLEIEIITDRDLDKGDFKLIEVNSMKKHLLSMYGNFCKNKEIIDLGKTTYETSTIETTDTDEFFAMGGTYETRSQENTDPDEFIFGPTSITKSVEATDEDEFIFCGPTMVTENVENSDPDEFLLQGPTNLTFTQENTDEDEFLSDILSDFNNKDFDEILLI